MRTRFLLLFCFLFVGGYNPSFSTGTQQPTTNPSSYLNVRGGHVPAAASGETPDISSIIAEYRQEIPARMKSENIPGLAIAVVDDQEVLWSEGFGYTDWDHKTPVTADTLFSIQSMSKSFTATAAMIAAQDGLVDLDTPIPTYLPDFHINSIFEQYPEQKITLRMLLSHTAGLAFEAPLGGNNDLARPSFEQHIASIADTWLMFPVGTRYSYSNLGIDLAGYILQVRSGEAFIQYVREKVLNPLGMASSTLDFNNVHAMPGRAIGHNPEYLGPLSPLSEWAIIPSGGVWTTANDMARYLRFHINKGALDGASLLREDLAETMYTPPNEAARLAGYALGISISHQYNTREFQHGGGGFGFNSNMVWFPELKLGLVVLTNAEHKDLVGPLPEEILMKIIITDLPLYRERGLPYTPMEPALPPASQPAPLSDLELAELIEAQDLPADSTAQARRIGFAGTYIFCRWGIPVTSAEIKVIDGQLSLSSQGQTGNLVEVQPGLFFDLVGDAVDLRGPVPMAGNTQLAKVNEPGRTARIFFYPLCAAVFLSTLFYWPAKALTRQSRRKKGLPYTQPSRLFGWSGLLAGLASLASLICLAFIARIPNLIDVPWPVPWHELRWYQFAGMSLPYAALLLAAGAAILVGLAWKKSAGGRGIRVYFTAVTLALMAFNLAILI